MRPVRESCLRITGRPAVKPHCQRGGRVARACAEWPAASASIQAVPRLSDGITSRLRVLAVHPPLAPDARGVPAPAAVACPYHRPVIQFIRVVAHRVIRVVAHVDAHRAAGMRMYDGAALAIVQAEDRQRDPVQVGKHGGAAVCSAILLVSLVVSFRTVLACGVAWRPVSAGRPRRACARIVRAIEGTEDRTA